MIYKLRTDIQEANRENKQGGVLQKQVCRFGVRFTVIRATLPAILLLLLILTTRAQTPPPASTVQFTGPSFSTIKVAGNTPILVSRLGDLSQKATVDFATSDGTASQRNKYTAAAGTLTFAPGQSAVDFDILITDDLYHDGDQTVNITLSDPVGAQLGAQSTTVLTIVDTFTTPATTNPADSTNFFVIQQYADFLSRTADSAGLSFWANSIDSCGADPECLHNRRVAVADAFFFEKEFHDTAAYVYLIHKASFGTIPKYSQFITDRARVTASASLDERQTNFAVAFTTRAAFIERYPLLLSGPEFVDSILENVLVSTGVDLSTERDNLLAAYNSGSDQAHGRGAVLKRIAQRQTFIDGQYNESFVVSQYFGYLRRDPDADGLAFWLGRVNAGPLRDQGIQQAMACSFITSNEYQTRFSPVVTQSNSSCPQ